MMSKKLNRRQLLKALAAGSLMALPERWTTPLVEVGQLTVFAQGSLQTGIVSCGQPVSGGNSADTRVVEFGKASGTFTFSYETFSVPDRIIVLYEGIILYDTGCVGKQESVSISYSGLSTQITIQVIPNCEGTPFTGWNWVVSCP